MGVLLMLMTVGGLFLATILFAVAVWKKQTWLKTFVLGAVAVWFIFYAAVLLTVSLSSEETTLAPGEAKEFCGFYFDCHLHASVSGVQKTKQIGDKTANGEFYIVTVKISNDAKQAELGLHAPDAQVLDESGKVYDRDYSAENILIGSATESPFDRTVAAGGAFEKVTVFDLPIDVKNPRLDIAEGIGIDKLIESVLIGDEDSFLHRRSYFKLDADAQTAGN